MENSTDIITGQYVRLREVPASIADRIVATVIDCAVLVAMLGAQAQWHNE